MKKTISIALLAVAFGLVGCTAQDKPDVTAHRDNAISSADQRPKCKHCHKGKLGMEKVEKDTAK